MVFVTIAMKYYGILLYLSRKSIALEDATNCDLETKCYVKKDYNNFFKWDRQMFYIYRASFILFNIAYFVTYSYLL